MTAGRGDPYRTLGVSAAASDAELRAAYRRLVQLHHPDHNGGSIESARRFEEVQEAYAQIRRMRDAAPGAPQQPRPSASQPPGSSSPPPPRSSSPPPPRSSSPPPPRSSAPPPRGDTETELRLAELERQIQEAQRARERARQAAREATQEAAEATARRPTDEELGYITTDDSLGKILADARAELGERVADLLDDVASKLSRGDSPRARE
jgi:hypothetical protein